jgi:hypothetical protein
MNQRELDEEVARATGEPVETIQSLGFGLMTLPTPRGAVERRLDAPTGLKPRKPRAVRLRLTGKKALPRLRAPMRYPCGNALRRRAPAWRERIIAFPRVRLLTFEPWRA